MKKIIVLLLCLPVLGLAYVFPSNTHYEVCFSPGRNCTKMLTHRIDQAKKTIYVQAYSYNSWKITDSLIAASRRGVDVNIIFDKSNFKPPYNRKLDNLLRNGIKIWKDYKLNIAHNKVMIIDNKTVETGSFNFTYSAQKYNAENMLIVVDAQFAHLYMANWLDRQKQSSRWSQ